MAVEKAAVVAVEMTVELAADPSLDSAAAAGPEVAVDLGHLDTLLSLFYTSLMLLSLLLATAERFNLTSQVGDRCPAATARHNTQDNRSVCRIYYCRVV